MLNEIPSASDEQVITKVLSGDTDSFRIIVNRYQSHLYNIGIRFFKNAHDAEDFVQDVFLKAYSELGSFKKISAFKSWLIRIAYNFGINRIKERKIESRSIEGTEMSDMLTPEKKAVANETNSLLSRAIENLPEKYRVCVDLYFFMGFRYSEIEQITGYPVNSIKSNVLRAKHLLRDKLRGSIAEDYYEM